MRWNQRYVLKSYIRGALWVVPFFAVVAYLVFARVAEALNRWLVLSAESTRHRISRPHRCRSPPLLETSSR